MFDITKIVSFLKNLISRKSEKIGNNIEINKIKNHRGTINIQNTNFVDSPVASHYFDSVYKCYFYKGDRVCSVCFPSVFKLRERGVGGILHLFCDQCGKVFYKEN